ncbi:emp24/gp25L/p24 family protein [Gregarina niphandrodes]|uniref:Emp24/gp25L/p24 family protein n=1 Tax=Gregarina niphandrodes TaxID=110365 RepID=A0A023AXY1_GRENI|nr:emp24/gp25L/p24 family protein [Gregarina niphandrodes]EZG43512.1 emp24/gp25L/p24 family protein [Gregarina niphandrodes]|eukprot:XP_011133262.1 emp24/gp25L/p24 family protein [Gregarina niphandrodes]
MFTQLGLLLLGASASYFDIQLTGNVRKCYTEDLSLNTLIVAEVEPRDNVMLSVEISMRSPHEVYFQEVNQKAMKTAFTMQQTGTVDVCVQSADTKKGVSYAGLRVLTGTLAKDFSNVAKKEHLDPVINELKSIEGMMTDYNSRQRRLVGTEAATRKLVDLAHSRVVNLAIANIGVVVACNVVMALILKAFFKSKKII